MKKEYGFDTLQVHAGQRVDSETGARAMPIYQTAAYMFEDFDHAEKLFGLQEAGNIYTRIGNPTVGALEERMAALDGGVGALALASGSAAITYTIMNIARAGDEIVAANTLYGGTHNLFQNTLPQYGIVTTFVDPNVVENFEKAITNKTKALYIESIGNPNANIVDIEEVAKIAHKHKIPLIVDNTFGTPYLLRPIDFGADIVVYSATKYLGGHGTTIGGIVVDSGKFDWEGSGKFPGLTTPDPSYHGLIYTKDIGSAAFILRMRVILLRDMGAALSPFNAFLLLQGLETLSLRMERHVRNTEKIVDYVKGHPSIIEVNYPGLVDSAYYKYKEKYFSKGAGAIFTFRIKGGKEKAKKFINALELFSLLANVADAKSLVIHPASTTHSQLPKEVLEKSGITEDTIRLSIGIEDVWDLIHDLENALKA